MSSLNLVSAAVASAVMIAQPIDLPKQHQSISHILHYEELVTGVDITELTNRVFMAERVLFALYQIASKQHLIFKQSTEIEWLNMFKEAAGLLFYCQRYAQKGSELETVLNQFKDTLDKITHLFKACEYQKRAEEVLNDRLYTETQTVNLKFDGTLSREEKRALLLSKRRV